ncbi:MAG: hypothetical protein QGH45_21645 [Myxococcota bacterium]|nr:hypothetical protein [Myxococcota bacterium]
MSFLLLIPVLLSTLMMAAHFLYHGHMVIVGLCLLSPLLLLIRRPWVARSFQLALAFGAFEWVRTAINHVQERTAMDEDWLRLAIILGSVAALTGGSALLFQTRRLRRRYRIPDSDSEPVG